MIGFDLREVIAINDELQGLKYRLGAKRNDHSANVKVALGHDPLKRLIADQEKHVDEYDEQRKKAQKIKSALTDHE